MQNPRSSTLQCSNTVTHGGFTLIEILIAVLVIGIVSSLALVSYSNYVDTANAQVLGSNYETAIQTAQKNYVAAEQLASTGAVVTRVVPADSQGWVDLLNSTNSAAPEGGLAYEVGTGNTATGAVGVVFTGTYGDGSSTVTLSRPAYAGFVTESVMVAQTDF